MEGIVRKTGWIVAVDSRTSRGTADAKPTRCCRSLTAHLSANCPGSAPVARLQPCVDWEFPSEIVASQSLFLAVLTRSGGETVLVAGPALPNPPSPLDFESPVRPGFFSAPAAPLPVGSLSHRTRPPKPPHRVPHDRILLRVLVAPLRLHTALVCPQPALRTPPPPSSRSSPE